jgi:GMP synthase (glutamine-hydrolysing)
MERNIVLDFGGQCCHLISRRVRDLGVFSEVLPNDTPVQKLKQIDGLKGIILSGGAASVYDKDSPKCDKNLLSVGVPILGICYGHQLIGFLSGGKVRKGTSGEYGIADLEVLRKDRLVRGLSKHEKVWMNHRDIVEKLPAGFSVLARTKHSDIAIFANDDKRLYGVQFHPEVTHTINGM